jgi:DNA gyrase/topoisomerase IV subunit A
MEEKNNNFSVDKEELKSETKETISQVKETIKNVNIKEDSVATKNFVVEIFKEPINKLKEIIEDNSGKFLKFAILILAVYVLVEGVDTIIFSEDGTARRTKMTEIPITNNWITTNPDNNFITAVVPVYEGEDNYIITMNKDYKIKIFNAEEINAKKVQTGKIIAAAIIGKTDKNVLIYNEYGEYIYIDKSEIPELSRSSSGNSTSFDKGNKIKIIPISKDIEVENLIVGFVENKDDGICTYTAFSEEFLHLGHRTNKPKEFFKLKHSNFVGVGVVNAKTKNNSTVSFISPYNINTVNGKNIKEKMDFKKISVSPFGLIQIPNMEK